jgi:hypothetical protein
MLNLEFQDIQLKTSTESTLASCFRFLRNLKQVLQGKVLKSFVIKKGSLDVFDDCIAITIVVISILKRLSLRILTKYRSVKCE